MKNYQPTEFWEQSHSAVPVSDIRLGMGIHHVAGGQSEPEAKTLYRLRAMNARRILRRCPLSPNPKIFELGSGGGYWVEFFRALQPRAFVGSDLSHTAVQ